MCKKIKLKNIVSDKRHNHLYTNLLHLFFSMLLQKCMHNINKIDKNSNKHLHYVVKMINFIYIKILKSKKSLRKYHAKFYAY